MEHSNLKFAHEKSKKEPINFTDETIFPALHRFLYEVNLNDDTLGATTKKYLDHMGDPPDYDLEIFDQSRTVSENS